MIVRFSFEVNWPHDLKCHVSLSLRQRGEKRDSKTLLRYYSILPVYQ